jgi:deoxyribodipyrimidine photo-lyase
MTTSVLVFTRDLRLRDNPALAAAASADQLIPLFVIDDVIVRRHAANATRLAFLLDSLRELDAGLRSLGGRLVIRRGAWANIVVSLAARHGAGQIHLADDVSGYARRRLAGLRSLAASTRIEVIAHPGVTAVGPAIPSPAGGGPYHVFTAYYRRWLASPRRPAAPTPARVALPAGIEAGRIPGLTEICSAGPRAVAAPRGGEPAGLVRLVTWAADRLAGYERARDDLAADATSRISPYLHMGCLSPLAVVTELSAQTGGQPFIRQLAWRDFFCQLLAARPDAAWHDFKTRGDHWHRDPAALAAWQDGRTGYPVVDAAMRQLSREGFMHNRARMIAASFLTKDLYIDWRAGAAHFMALLADADVACNQLNWQWVAGTGTDRQPYRMFNPTRQSNRFDPRGEYIARYVPELAGLGPDQIHDPPPDLRRSRRYPAPIVDHEAAVASWRARHRPRQP